MYGENYEKFIINFILCGCVKFVKLNTQIITDTFNSKINEKISISFFYFLYFFSLLFYTNKFHVNI